MAGASGAGPPAHSPSPVPDFGVQFLISLASGASAPERVTSPFSKFFTRLGRGSKHVLGRDPWIRTAVGKADALYRR